MQIPQYLKKGDKAGIVSPAGRIDAEKTRKAAMTIENWGLQAVFGNHCFAVDNQFAGTDRQRAEDFQRMLDDPEIKAIFCTRGGYGSIRIIGKLDFSKFRKNPKWIIGFSDLTVFHTFLNQILSIESLHAAMLKNFPLNGIDEVDTAMLKNVLFGKKLNYCAEAHKLNRQGTAYGELTGGNLSILYNLRGTPYDIYTKGKILFIEEVGEYLYHLDRMMMNLKISGYLEKLDGLIVGQMTGMKDNNVPFGKSSYQIIREAVEDYNFPVCFGFKAGHDKPNLPLIMGRKLKIEVKPGDCTVLFD